MFLLGMLVKNKLKKVNLGYIIVRSKAYLNLAHLFCNYDANQI